MFFSLKILRFSQLRFLLLRKLFKRFDFGNFLGDESIKFLIAFNLLLKFFMFVNYLSLLICELAFVLVYFFLFFLKQFIQFLVITLLFQLVYLSLIACDLGFVLLINVNLFSFNFASYFNLVIFLALREFSCLICF